MPTSKKRKLSLFFDNDQNNFIDKYHCKNVKPVLIEDTNNIYSDNYNIYTSLQVYNNYLSNLSYGAFLYGQYIRKKSKYNIDSYDPVSGVNSNHIKRLIIPNMVNIKALIFDWDRTLTVFEGLYSIYPNVLDLLKVFELQKDVRVKDVAEYYLGGSKRVKNLRKVWIEAKNHNVPIYILSSNPSVGKFPTFFSQLLKSVDLNVPLKKIIFRGDLTKYEYIRENMKTVC